MAIDLLYIGVKFMNFNFKNVGILEDVTVECNGLTIITGLNSSGKTTIGKTIYALFDAVENIDIKNLNDKRAYASKAIRQVLNTHELRYIYITYSAEIQIAREKGNLLTDVDQENILDYLDREIPGNYQIDEIVAYIDKIKELLTDFDIDTILNSVIKDRTAVIQRVPFEKFKSNLNRILSELDEIKETVLSDMDLTQYSQAWIGLTLFNEFSGQIQPVLNKSAESFIEVKDENEIFTVRCSDDKYDVNYNSFNNTVNHIFMLDDIYDLDKAGQTYTNKSNIRYNILRDETYDLPTGYTNFINSRFPKSHSEKNTTWISRNSNLSIIDQDAIHNKCKSAFELIDKLLPGDFLTKQRGLYYLSNGTELNIKNLASGSKVFAIIKILLNLGAIDEKTILILDEPEVHLHPEWQNKYAELLVILTKTLGTKIILSTHSPNFLLALETLSKKHKIEDGFKVYLTQKNEDGYTVHLDEITHSIEEGYEVLAKPYLDMDTLRYEIAETEEE